MSKMSACRDTGSGAPANRNARHSLESIVRAYRLNHRKRAAEELNSFATELNLEAAIDRASLARTPDGRRYDHQRRLPDAVLQEVRGRLQMGGFQRCQGFDDVFKVVDESIGDVRGVGELMVYDTALRIGAYLGLLPQVIYLHRGTRVGARALGLNTPTAGTLLIEDLPPELRVLEPHEVEDVLCIFKSELVIVGGRNR